MHGLRGHPRRSRTAKRPCFPCLHRVGRGARVSHAGGARCADVADETCARHGATSRLRLVSGAIKGGGLHGPGGPASLGSRLTEDGPGRRPFPERVTVLRAGKGKLKACRPGPGPLSRWSRQWPQNAGDPNCRPHAGTRPADRIDRCRRTRVEIARMPTRTPPRPQSRPAAPGRGLPVLSPGDAPPLRLPTCRKCRRPVRSRDRSDRRSGRALPLAMASRATGRPVEPAPAPAPRVAAGGIARPASGPRPAPGRGTAGGSGEMAEPPAPGPVLRGGNARHGARGPCTCGLRPGAGTPGFAPRPSSRPGPWSRPRAPPGQGGGAFRSWRGSGP